MSAREVLVGTLDPGAPGAEAARISTDMGGARPIFHATHSSSGTVVFGESAWQVLLAANRQPRVDPAALRGFLATGRLSDGGRTLLADVAAVPRHFRLEARAGGVALVALPPATAAPSATMDESAERLRQLVLDSVAEALPERGAAFALSGGIDSSGLVGCAAHLGAAPLEAYCFATLPGELPDEWNERPWAEAAAGAAGARLHAVTVEPAEVGAAIGHALALQDFPFGSPVMLAQARVFAAMAEAGHSAVLSGHGPEILFGGTSAQAALRAAQLLRSARPVAARRFVDGAARFVGTPSAGLWRGAVHHLLASRTRRTEPEDPWTAPGWFRDRAPQDPPDSAPHDPAALIDDMLTASLGATSLMQEGRAAAALGLDDRQPYLSDAVIAFARSLPLDHAFSPEGRTKHVLRLALRGLVPPEILQREARVGFAVPALSWLVQGRSWAEPRYRELRALPFFAGPPAAEVWSILEAGGGRAWETAYRLWRWIVLLEWATARQARFE